MLARVSGRAFISLPRRLPHRCDVGFVLERHGVKNSRVILSVSACDMTTQILMLRVRAGARRIPCFGSLVSVYRHTETGPPCNRGGPCNLYSSANPANSKDRGLGGQAEDRSLPDHPQAAATSAERARQKQVVIKTRQRGSTYVNYSFRVYARPRGLRNDRRLDWRAF